MRPCGAGHQHHHHQGSKQQEDHGTDDALGHVLARVLGFFGGQRHAFNRQEQPHGKRQRRPHTVPAQRQHLAGTVGVGHGDVEQVVDIEVHDQRHTGGHDGEDRQTADYHHHFQRFTHARQVNADEYQIEDRVDPRTVETEQRFHRRPDKDDDGRRGQRIFDQHRKTGQKAPGRPHRLPGKAVTATRSRNGRRHFRQRQHQGQIHQPHKYRGNRKARPARLRDAEVPAGKIAGNNIRDAEPGEQNPARSPALELPFGKVRLMVVRHERSSVVLQL